MKYMSTVPTSTGWACEADLVSSGCLQASWSNPHKEGGVVLCSDGDTVYFDGGDECRHNLILGASGSGKSRLVILPSLLSMITAEEKRSIILTDVKGELEAATRPIAEQQGVYRIWNIDFERPERSHSWNPFAKANKLFFAGKTDAAWSELNKIASVLFSDGANARTDPFWKTISTSIFIAICDVLWQSGKSLTPASILRLSDTLPSDSDYDDNCALLVTIEKMPKRSIARSNMAAFRTLSPHNRGTTLGCYRTYLACLISRQDILAMTSGDSLDFEEIGKQPTILYISLADDNDACGKLQGMLIADLMQSLNTLAKRSPHLRLPVRTEFVLDELCNIKPCIESLSTALTISRSRGMRYTLAVQSYSQLIATYGHAGDTIAENCCNWICLFVSKDEVFREKLSALCGRNCYGESLITPSEIAQMPYRSGIVIRERCSPFYAQFEDLNTLIARMEAQLGSALPQAS